MWVVGEEVPCLAAGVDDGVGAVETGDGAPVGAQAGPDVFHRVQLRAVGRQGQPGEIVGQVEGRRTVPSGTVGDQHRMG